MQEVIEKWTKYFFAMEIKNLENLEIILLIAIIVIIAK